MKNGLVLLAAATISMATACQKKLETGVSQEKPIRGFSLLLRTEAAEESAIMAEAAAALREHRTLGSEAAERCWRVEEKRPRLREACLLLWSSGTEESDFFYGLLRSEAAHSRIAAIALAKNERALQKLNVSELLGLLTALAPEPPWVRAMALVHWKRANPDPGLPVAYALWKALQLPGLAPDPASLRWGMLAARALSISESIELHGSYCIPHAEGITQVRCWRFLSALIDPGTGESADPKLFSFSIPAHDSAWTVFARSFPERAALLERVWH